MKCSLKNFKKTILGLILSLLFPFIILSQNDNDNHRKYWYYKSRLNNDFVKVGLGQGESIPAQTRGKYNALGFNDPNAQMDWGDATSYLGYYIAVLATEYKLLADNNQDTKQTKYELFCALNAVNRLDYMGETFFNGQPNLNGYFVRDDVPSNFHITNYDHFNYYNYGSLSANTNSLSKGFASKINGGTNSTTSSLVGWETFTNSPQYNNGNGPIGGNGPIPEMSQDQAYAILYGLAFVKKFVPSWETNNNTAFGYGSGETSIATEATNINNRIVNFIKKGKDQYGNDCNNIANGWRIKNPITCNPVGYNHDSGHNGWGDEAWEFSYAIAEAGHVIKANDFGGGINLSLSPNYPTRGASLWNNTDYHNFFSWEFGDDLWHGLATVVVPGNGDNRLHVVNLSAICNCVYGSVLDKFEQWQEQIFENVPVLNWLGIVIKWITKLVETIIHTFLSVPGFYFNNTSTSISLNSYFGASDFDHAPLSRKVLHGGAYIQNSDYSFQYLLNSAPCDDIYYLPAENPAFSHVEWSSSDRIEHPKQRRGGIGAASDAPGAGEFSGLDYLLYHNLWYIYQMQQGNSPNIEDFSNIYVNKNGGFAPANTIYQAYETITTENTKFNPANNLGYMRAGKIIDFKEGTEILSGSNLHAYIQKYNCATDNGAYRMAGDSTQTNTQVVEDIHPHYVAYPKDELAVTEIKPNKHFTNLITELPPDVNDIMEVSMRNAYPEYSKELFVKPTVTSDNVKAYFKIDDDELAFINVVSLDGQNLYSSNYVGKERSGITIDMSSFPAGAYLLKFTTTKGTSKTQKIIKQ